jgi:single-stranded-DNA-specific exonuclease
MDQSDAVSQHVDREIAIRPGPFELLEAEMAALELGVDPVIAASTCTAVQNDLDAAKEWLYPSRALIRDAESTCPGIVEAAALLAEAVNKSEKVAIFGDYDVDGVSGAAILELGLEKLGTSCLVDHPSASEGFGITDRFIAEAAGQGCSTLCIVDCGSDQADVIAREPRALKIIVCDHHAADVSNPADAHINPNLHSPPPTAHTGSPLAWKLLVELYKQLGDRIAPPLGDWLFETPLFLAGMGLMADRGSVLIPEHRALLHLASDHAPAGVVALAANFDEDPALPGGLVRTQAVLNLGKRTSRVHASSARRVLTAQRAEDAEQDISALLFEYEAATVVREDMTEQALSQVVDQDVLEEPLAIAVLDESFSEYSGYSGVVASSVAGKSERSTMIFVPVIGASPPQLKFSGRPGARAKKKLGVLHRQLDDEKRYDKKARKALCEAVIAIGGHEEVVAGTVELGSLGEAISALRGWRPKKGPWKSFYSESSQGRPAQVVARKVAADRWRELENQSQLLAPFTQDSQPVAHEVSDISGASTNYNPRISVLAEVTFPEQPTEDPDRPGWLIATMRDDGGSERDARFPADVQPPPDGIREWVITVQPSPEVVFLRWSSAAE